MSHVYTLWWEYPQEHWNNSHPTYKAVFLWYNAKNIYYNHKKQLQMLAKAQMQSITLV